ncbi:DUF6531 domain-containing protein [Amycolatopsis sp. DG1A-15b]|uniref:DUF6531 domain-containing protein n=1 Tax=Amycolatopsis sp. DG1A-15b TaxID=3052846 RepID=UPI00255B650D|nr:DUF6531 domain-containing protein [Amycolatopsis sp. DG1A-15b]WIX91932.1 RHS repeat-associated core domain-containing protein [Amycolatopsis sp. DG1A-15b]
MVNPLVAETKDSTKAYSGISLLESANDLKSAIESGDWASVALGSVGTALDALSMAMDPFGAILAAGVGWLMEHVGPLKEALNGLTGNADEIAAQSETWKNVATELGSIGEDLTGMVKADTVSWTGNAADTYRQRAQDTVTLLETAQKGCEGASSGVKTAGEVVAAVRALVRDIIAELVGHLISWALQVLFTLGIGLTWVVPQVINAVAKTASKIADLVKRLVTALKALVPLLKRAGDLFADAAKALRNIKPGKAAPPPKHADIKSGPKDIGGPKGKGGPDAPPPKTDPPPKGDDSTTASGAKGGPDAPPKTDPAPAPKGPDDPPKSPDPTPNGSTTPSGAGKGGGGKSPDTTSPSSNKPDTPRDRGVGADDRVCKSDPIDVATGEMVLAQADVDFPGPLALVLERTHVSSYRAGRLFGASWASTVDQRLELDDEHACYFSPDGMILVYPLPVRGADPVFPLEGPRWTLAIDEETGAYVLDDPAQRRTLTFAAPSGPAPARGVRVLPLTGIEGGDGRTIAVTHDGDGRPVSWRHSDGYRVDLRIQGGRLRELTVVDAAGTLTVPVTSFDYDDRGRLAAVVNSSGRPMRFDYDTDGRITGWQDRNGAWYRYVYDQAGRCVRTVGDQGYLDGSFAYEPGVTRHTDSLGHTSTFELNALNQVVRETDPLGAVTEYVHDRYDRLLSRTDPLGRTTTYTYDAFGRPTTVTRPDGSTVDLNVDPAQPLFASFTDGERTWNREYAGELGEGVPDLATEQIGVAGEFDYERLLEQPEDGGEDHRDLFGRPRVRTDVFGGQVRFDWTVEGLRAARTGRTGEREQWRYDAEGNEIEHVDPVGAVERAEYGPFGLRTASVDATGARTVYGYDTELRLTSVTNPLGLTWHYRYDAAGRLVEERDFDGRVLRFTYDAAGQLVRSVNGLGEAVDYTHDALGNVVRRQTPTGITTYAYDPMGRLVRATGDDVVLEFERDADGRVLRETVDGRSVLFSYADDGTVLARRTPSGVDSHWTQDAAGHPAALAFAGHAVRFQHDAAGRELRRSVDGALELAQTFDAGDRLTGQVVATPGAGTVQQRRYEYRADGSLAAVTDALTGVTQYRYDAAGRVVEVAAADHRENFRYDAAGNLTETAVDGPWPVDAEVGSRGYAANTLTGAGAVAYAHDAQGRLVARHVQIPGGVLTWTFTWDAVDRLIGVRTPDGTQWRYRYDPLGRRIAKLRLTADARVAERVDFVWADTQLVEQVHTDAEGRRRVLTWERHPGDDRPLVQAELVDGTRRLQAVVTDQIGAPAELVAPGGTLTWRARSGLWGKVVTAGGTPLRFPGQYADPETGLHYNVYRYYDPVTGRYLSQDPLGLGPAPNPAGYVPNPLVGADPLGLMLTAPCGKPLSGGAGGSRPPKRPGGGHGPGQLGQPSKKPKTSGSGPGRSTKQGGGTQGGRWDGDRPYGKGDSNNARNPPQKGHLTDVEDLNKAATNKQLTPELQKYLADNGINPKAKWVKGHLENDNIGGPGTSSNMTPLTTKANSAHKNGIENSVKELIGRANSDAWKREGLDGIGIKYHVEVSPDVKFPNSKNPFEQSIRDHLVIKAEYTGIDQAALDKMARNGMSKLPELPPVGTKMDTVTGVFTTPDGKVWTKGTKGQDFSGQGLVWNGR